jgi:hypothetical protein
MVKIEKVYSGSASDAQPPNMRGGLTSQPARHPIGGMVRRLRVISLSVHFPRTPTLARFERLA